MQQEIYSAHHPGYREDKFDSLDDALDFAEGLPINAKLDISQYGFQIHDNSDRPGKERTGGIGEFHYLILTDLMDPDYVAGSEETIRAESEYYFDPNVDSTFYVAWRLE
jgi:hypothetical protein